MTIFLINLDRSTIRLGRMIDQFRDLGIRADRVSAIDGRQVPEWMRDQFEDSPLSDGEVGCCASHMLVYKLMIERDLAHAIVIEDDAVLAPEFIRVAQAAIEAAPTGWDVIKLCNRPDMTTIELVRLNRHRLVRFSRQPESTVAYAISRSGAEKLLAPRHRDKPIDTQMRMPWEIGIEQYGVVPRVAWQGDAKSIIQTMGGQSTNGRFRTICRRGDRSFLRSKVDGMTYVACRTLNLLRAVWRVSGWHPTV